jgi:ABC-2 type transport system ATP-binding protein
MSQEPERATDAAVQAFGLTRKFGDLTAVDHADLLVARGEIFGLIGPNGSGKSTLIKMLTTLLPPSTGSAKVAGHDIVERPAEVRRCIGYVPQLLSADGALTGHENLRLAARLYAIPRAERAQRIAQALARMGLTEVADRVAGRYSGGMIRRLEIAQSLLNRPSVLFLDEPTVGLDPAARQTVWGCLLELRDRFGATMMVTSHHLEEISDFCDRIALIDRGRIVTVGSLGELKARVGPNATLDDVFISVIAAREESESGESYAEVRRVRRSIFKHGS